MNIIREAEALLNEAMSHLSGFQTLLDTNQQLVSAAALFLTAAVIFNGIRKMVRHFRKVPTDARRFFSNSDRVAGFARAGGRCEMDGFLNFRCRARAEHGDHHYPHSRGGATTLDNFVAACANHNLAKSDKVPSKMATRRMERRRKNYFPEGAPVAVGSRVGVRTA
jgi:hypothetical protein